MRVLVDTSVWSLALRRDAPAKNAPEEHLRSLIADHRVEMIGPIRLAGRVGLIGQKNEKGGLESPPSMDSITGVVTA